MKGHRVTLAWDRPSKEITYLFVEDPKLVGDSGLQIGGSCRIAGHMARFLRWSISPDWTETFSDWSGGATWYAVLRPVTKSHSYDLIRGFVQSRYLPVPIRSSK